MESGRTLLRTSLRKRHRRLIPHQNQSRTNLTTKRLRLNAANRKSLRLTPMRPSPLKRPPQKKQATWSKRRTNRPGALVSQRRPKGANRRRNGLQRNPRTNRKPIRLPKTRLRHRRSPIPAINHRHPGRRQSRQSTNRNRQTVTKNRPLAKSLMRASRNGPPKARRSRPGACFPGNRTRLHHRNRQTRIPDGYEAVIRTRMAASELFFHRRQQRLGRVFHEVQHPFETTGTPIVRVGHFA